MCWITTFNSAFFEKNKASVIGAVRRANIHNDDGASLVFLGESSRDDLVLRTMDIEPILDLLYRADKQGRWFIHLRMATTYNIGVGFTHAFDNLNGMFYMHNGVISNEQKLAVDSFNMVYNHNALDGELFANVFKIDTENRSYEVIRKVTGSLFTDNKGNFATSPISNMNKKVKAFYSATFDEYRDTDTSRWRAWEHYWDEQQEQWEKESALGQGK